MINKIIKWLRDRKEKEAEESHRNGWCYAMHAYFIQGIATEEIYSYVECANSFNSYTSFDAGVEAALALITDLIKKSN